MARRANAEAEQLRAQLAKAASAGGTNPFTAAMMDVQKQGRERQLESDLSGLTARLQLTPTQLERYRQTQAALAKTARDLYSKVQGSSGSK